MLRLAERHRRGHRSVTGVLVRGVRAGNCFTRDQAEKLLLAPPNSLMGLRDRAILALLIGCGLRRDELVNLTFEHLQQRAGRWVIVDVVGKGRRVRTVPVPGWPTRARGQLSSPNVLNSVAAIPPSAPLAAALARRHACCKFVGNTETTVVVSGRGLEVYT